MESGRRGPVGDAKDLGHFHHRKVEVVVQRDHCPLVEAQPVEGSHEPLTIRDVRCEIGALQCRRVGLDLNLHTCPTTMPAGCLVAGIDGQPPDPGVPRLRVAQSSQIPPREDHGVLDRIFRSIRVVQHEAGEAEQPTGRGPDQLAEGLAITGLGLSDEGPIQSTSPLWREAPLRALKQ